MATDQSLASVGRIGELKLDYVRQGKQTVVARSYCTSPWHYLPPAYLDETGAACTFLMNPSGGLVGGDTLSIKMTLGTETHVLVSTPSANRIYNSLSETSAQVVELAVGPRAIMEWVPDVTIPFAGSRLRQSVHVRLGAGATILLWDAIASGRMACGERWKFESLENEIWISVESGASLVERARLAPSSESGRIGLAEEWNYVASFYLIGDGVSEEMWKHIETDMVALLEPEKGPILAGVSRPAAPGLCVKLLAKSATDLARAFEGLWRTARRELWNLPVPALRRY